jgi:hypothetical protein
MVSFNPRPLYPQYPLHRRLHGPQSRSRLCEEVKNVLSCQRQDFYLLHGIVGMKVLGREADHLRLMPSSRMVELYPHSPMSS